MSPSVTFEEDNKKLRITLPRSGTISALIAKGNKNVPLTGNLTGTQPGSPPTPPSPLLQKITETVQSPPMQSKSASSSSKVTVEHDSKAVDDAAESKRAPDSSFEAVLGQSPLLQTKQEENYCSGLDIQREFKNCINEIKAHVIDVVQAEAKNNRLAMSQQLSQICLSTTARERIPLQHHDQEQTDQGLGLCSHSIDDLDYPQEDHKFVQNRLRSDEDEYQRSNCMPPLSGPRIAQDLPASSGPIHTPAIQLQRAAQGSPASPQTLSRRDSTPPPETPESELEGHAKEMLGGSGMSKALASLHQTLERRKKEQKASNSLHTQSPLNGSVCSNGAEPDPLYLHSRTEPNQVNGAYSDEAVGVA